MEQSTIIIFFTKPIYSETKARKTEFFQAWSVKWSAEIKLKNEALMTSIRLRWPFMSPLWFPMAPIDTGLYIVIEPIWDRTIPVELLTDQACKFYPKPHKRLSMVTNSSQRIHTVEGHVNQEWWESRPFESPGLYLHYNFKQ